MDIQSAINRHGTTKAELARKMETSASYITQLVSGHSSPSMKMLDKLAELIGCHRWEFFIDEMDREEVAQILGLTMPQAPQQQAGGLPFGNDTQGTGTAVTSQPSQTKPVPDVSHAVAASLICPHCGAAFVVEVKQV
jgi:transcriptional regulator with XRE-family HTH domain